MASKMATAPLIAYVVLNMPHYRILLLTLLFIKSEQICTGIFKFRKKNFIV